MRGLLAAPFLDAHAAAAVTLQRLGMRADAERILERVAMAGSMWAGQDASARTYLENGAAALADWAVAIGRAVQGGHPDGTYVNEFHAIDDHGVEQPEPVDPSMFQTDVHGAAAVWAARLAVAAINGDDSTVEALAGVLVAGERPPHLRIQEATVHLASLLVAAAPLAAAQLDRRNAEDLERTFRGEATAYWVECQEGCAHWSASYRADRDAQAADHVLQYAHIVTTTERWWRV